MKIGDQVRTDLGNGEVVSKHTISLGSFNFLIFKEIWGIKLKDTGEIIYLSELEIEPLENEPIG